MSQREKVLAIKSSLAKLYRSRCMMCGAKKSKSGFTFHHIWYESGEKTYRDFPNPLAYYEYLAPLIRANTGRFMLLCSDHHQALERACRYGDRMWRKLGRLRARTLKARQ